MIPNLPNNAGTAPDFSIIIPTYARPHSLRSCLASLVRLQYPAPRFEVVVVDDGSPELLDNVVAPFSERLNVCLLRTANRGPGAARNTGAGRARGRFLAFTDDDCWPAPDWLNKLAARLAQHPDCLIGGRTINRLVKNPYSAASQLIVDLVYAYYNRNAADCRFFASNNMAMAAERFHRLGGFDDSFIKPAAEDRDFCDRWVHQGGRMLAAAEAVVWHAHRLTLRSFCKQHFAYGRGACRYQQLRARRRSGRLRDDLQFHARLPVLIREPINALPRSRAAAVGTLLVLWQVANAAGFFFQRLQDGHRTSSCKAA